MSNLRAIVPNFGEQIGITETDKERVFFTDEMSKFLDELIYELQPEIGVGVYLTANEAIVANTQETLTNLTEEWDLGGNFSSGVFTAPRDGRYRIHGYVAFDVAADQDRLRVIIRKDGSNHTIFFNPSSSVRTTTVTFTKNYSLENGDTLEVAVLNIDNNDTIISTDNQTAFYIDYLGCLT